jgi:Na+-transporting NADH:ubiquinone oxidoreductase subunit A
MFHALADISDRRAPMIRIKRGLTLPLVGEPEQLVHPAPAITRVGILPGDYPGLRPQWLVQDGERVRTGQPVLCDASDPSLRITAPATGCVHFEPSASGPGALSIALEPDEFVEFSACSEDDLAELTDEQVRAQMLAAGLWPAFRTRPFLHIPDAQVRPHAIFVTAMDTQPLAPRAETLIEADLPAFAQGLTAISHLTTGLVYVCKAPAAYVPVPDIVNIKVEEFAGEHPAGLAGTHIHYLDRIGLDRVGHGDRQVWSINYQDVMAIGRLFTTGRIDPDRVIALAGSQVVDARLLRVRLGADLRQLTAGQLKAESGCVLSGSVLHGRAVDDARPYLGRFHQQVAVLPVQPGSPQRWWGWGTRRFSALPVFLSRLLGISKFRFCLDAADTPQPPLVTAAFERVWPLRTPVLPLLDALVRQDVPRAIALGALELAEEDLALCSFVCPGRQDYGALLRAVLDQAQRLAASELERGA